MDFSRYQLDADRTTRRLWLAYGLAVLGVVLVFNVAAVLAWRLERQGLARRIRTTAWPAVVR